MALSNRRRSQMATTARHRPTAGTRAVPRSEAARRIAALLEEHMETSGLTEEEKSKRVRRFSRAVTKDLRARPRRRE